MKVGAASCTLCRVTEGRPPGWHQLEDVHVQRGIIDSQLLHLLLAPNSPDMCPHPVAPSSAPMPAVNKHSFVLWKELMPLLRGYIPEDQHNTLAGCLLAVVRLFGDVLGWAFNPAYLPVLHHHLYSLAVDMERCGVGDSLHASATTPQYHNTTTSELRVLVWEAGLLAAV